MRSGTDLLGDGERGATPIELFFDLVFVFAVTQLSHALLHHLSLGGAVQTAILLLAVWWAWLYTSWVTSWFDPDRTPIRLLLIAVMLVSLVMSAAIPDAFGRAAWTFTIAYLAIQVGRTAFLIVASRERPELRANFVRVLVWFLASGVLWLAGAALGGGARTALWALAVLVDYIAPLTGFRAPGLGRSAPQTWTISGSHLAERCQLFIIIALGESILVTGATATGLTATPANTIAFVVAFLGSAGLWWVYFHRTAEAGKEHISRLATPSTFALTAYDYFHVIMVAGVIVTAVGDELTISHPTGHTGAATAAAVLGGPALFLLGVGLFQRAMTGRLPWPHLAGIAALAVLAALVPVATPLTVAAAATAVVLTVAAWAARGDRAPDHATPLT
ncbi:low temperature requirement protein A [Catellatospora paridis]|uniref:low temperature requirement protein A n=1 Tax=Catellatospora paridis TaxID=1617086 RepID=UPI001E522F79|nr:low temperature requirement protein A [Catellatospora paridis]